MKRHRRNLEENSRRHRREREKRKQIRVRGTANGAVRDMLLNDVARFVEPASPYKIEKPYASMPELNAPISMYFIAASFDRLPLHQKSA